MGANVAFVPVVHVRSEDDRRQGLSVAIGLSMSCQSTAARISIIAQHRYDWLQARMMHAMPAPVKSVQ
jgi:hypothetical protein